VVEVAVEVEEEERGRDLDLNHTRSVYHRCHSHRMLPISICSRARKPISTANYRSNCFVCASGPLHFWSHPIPANRHFNPYIPTTPQPLQHCHRFTDKRWWPSGSESPASAAAGLLQTPCILALQSLARTSMCEDAISYQSFASLLRG
jgi:hypothetical protein